MKKKKYQNFLTFSLMLINVLLLSSCSNIFFDPKGEIALEQSRLTITAFFTMLIVVIPAILLIIIFSWKYRQENKKKQYDPNFSHSYIIECIIWIIPIIIIAFLGYITWKSTYKLEPNNALKNIINKNNPPITIEVIALDWKWLFIYPEQKIATINYITIPINKPVVFKITSNTVMNSFFIPKLGSQIYAMNGMETRLQLIANYSGMYKGISSNFSGKGFSNMKFKVFVTKNIHDFNKWIKNIQKSTHRYLNTMDDFIKIANPSENNVVEYFICSNNTLFNQIINKFKIYKNIH